MQDDPLALLVLDTFIAYSELKLSSSKTCLEGVSQNDRFLDADVFSWSDLNILWQSILAKLESRKDKLMQLGASSSEHLSKHSISSLSWIPSEYFLLSSPIYKKLDGTSENLPKIHEYRNLQECLMALLRRDVSQENTNVQEIFALLESCKKVRHEVAKNRIELLRQRTGNCGNDVEDGASVDVSAFIQRPTTPGASLKPESNEKDDYYERRSTSKTMSVAERKAYIASDRHKDWKRLALSSLKELINHRNGPIFISPVREDDAPSYYTIVKYPLCLQGIKQKIRDDIILSIEDLHKDLLILFTNALVYNGKGSIVYDMAWEMIDVVDSMILGLKRRNLGASESATDNDTTHTSSDGP